MSPQKSRKMHFNLRDWASFVTETTPRPINNYLRAGTRCFRKLFIHPEKALTTYMSMCLRASMVDTVNCKLPGIWLSQVLGPHWTRQLYRATYEGGVKLEHQKGKRRKRRRRKRREEGGRGEREYFPTYSTKPKASQESKTTDHYPLCT